MITRHASALDKVAWRPANAHVICEAATFWGAPQQRSTADTASMCPGPAVRRSRLWTGTGVDGNLSGELALSGPYALHERGGESYRSCRARPARQGRGITITRAAAGPRTPAPCGSRFHGDLTESMCPRTSLGETLAGLATLQPAEDCSGPVRTSRPSMPDEARPWDHRRRKQRVGHPMISRLLLRLAAHARQEDSRS